MKTLTSKKDEKDEKDATKAQSQVKEMCVKLLANQIIEDFKINKKE